MYYGTTSQYVWHDSTGRSHTIEQGEGGEQGDSLMPALFSIGMAEALRNAQTTLQPNETLLAYLDDTYILSTPDRALTAYTSVTTTLRNHTGIDSNLGKTVCWNKAGLEPPGMSSLGPDV